MNLKLDIFTLEVVGDSSPTYSITVPDGMKMTKEVVKARTATKEIEIPGEITHTLVDVEKQYEPVYETTTEIVDDAEIQSTVIKGYSKPIFNEEGEITSFETVEETGSYTVQVDQIQQSESTFETVEETEEYSEAEPMSVEELLYEKYRMITEEARFDYAYADEFLNEEDIDLSYPKHLANTGVKLIELLPHGMCITKEISLDVSSDIFQLYMEADDGVTAFLHKIEKTTDENDNIISSEITEGIEITGTAIVLNTPITTFRLSFQNTTDNKRKVHSYALMYKGVDDNGD